MTLDGDELGNGVCFGLPFRSVSLSTAQHRQELRGPMVATAVLRASWTVIIPVDMVRSSQALDVL